ncbi:murein DD-endopeptidase MepM/ murein hydrolase activator NlpD [Nocardioides sp. BE266]|uniref:M23 family metallopeptidase n=1 Tax=Nocardioides sp. BE266 TaxID=2817725 RepID=UPI002860094F|nr:M23 family metallopeptidase [Nocardioides sp. BE266]MDR7252692.1 murein DD-endopeptidase MepM/ murein hydrolase activator NlpD [Nocardioides sp. BE266]
MGDIAFNTVWQPGTGTQWVKWGMTDDEFKAHDAVFFHQGLRVTSLAFHEGRIAAVWRPGTGTQWVKWGMTDDEFKAHDANFFPQGLRVTTFVLHGDRIAAVWRPGTGTQWVKWGMTDDEFTGHDSVFFPQGLRVTSLFMRNGRIAAVWQPGTGTQWVKWGLSFGEFAAFDRQFFAEGLRLTSLWSEDGRYAAVWRPGSGEQWWSSRRCEVDFSTEDGAYFPRGLRIASLGAQDDPFGAYKYPWKGGDSRRVGQGNNSTPPDSHTGVQAWAFDFDMDEGTEVRAARSGTVEWVQESLTTNISPSSTTVPADSRDYWGNVVRLRHAGGFTSWYFHLKPNEVRVNVGDVVAQGDVLALSGNTGRSSGPHLHFQVQADSTDWGSSVAHTFGADCQQPATGDTVTSDNAG